MGQLAGIEDDVNVSAEDASYTNPEQVQDFVERQVLTLLPLLSAQATVLSNLNPVRDQTSFRYS